MSSNNHGSKQGQPIFQISWEWFAENENGKSQVCSGGNVEVWQSVQSSCRCMLFLLLQLKWGSVNLRNHQTKMQIMEWHITRSFQFQITTTQTTLFILSNQWWWSSACSSHHKASPFVWNQDPTSLLSKQGFTTTSVSPFFFV